MPKISLAGVQTSTPRVPAPFPLSPQQEHILNFVIRGRGNAIIDAVAGSGKTSTLIEVCKDLDGTAAFLAFNKSIATEISRQLAAAGVVERAVKAATFHSVGFQAWMRHAPRSGRNVRGEKLMLLSDKLGIPRLYSMFAARAVSMAKQHLFGVRGFEPMDETEGWLSLVEHFDLLDLIPQGEEDIDEEEFLETGLAWALRLLRQSIEEADTLIDFDDMIYMPLLRDLRFWQYDWVLIDEAQDTNGARREISKRLLKPSGRLIAVGDPHQAIYGFTGASHDAMDLIASDFQCDTLPLSVTRRCPQKVVRLAQQYVPHIEAAPEAPEGVVRRVPKDQFNRVVPQPTDAILCRNTRPLIEYAFSYLRRHIGCHIEGREIGAGLVTLTRKWKSAQTISDLREHLNEYLDRETEKLLSQHKEAKLAAIEDRVQTLLALASGLADDDPIEALVALINKLFKDSDGLSKPTITLSTIHKAKGREWDTVYLLGANQLMPSPYARQEWQLQQEANLMYVAVTRAKQELVFVDFPARR